MPLSLTDINHGTVPGDNTGWTAFASFQQINTNYTSIETFVNGLETDIDNHTALTNEHIDWTNATSALQTSGSISTTGTGTIISAGTLTASGSFAFDGVTLTGIQTSGEGFSDDDVSIMTSAAIDDRINVYVPTTITVADESTDTTCYPLFVTAVTGDLAPKSGTNLTFNSNTGSLSIGESDAVAGTLNMYGAGTSTLMGGTINFYVSADYDTTDEYYKLQAYGSGFSLGTYSENDSGFNYNHGGTSFDFKTNAITTTGNISTTGSGTISAAGDVTGANLSGTNTGDQTSIVGITGTKSEFDTACSDGDFMYVGDAPTSHNHAYSEITGTHGNEDHSSTFITSSGVTYENLSANSDIGTGATQVAQGDHNHDSDYISVVSTPTTGNFPQLTASGELVNSAYDENSFATAGHSHAYSAITGTHGNEDHSSTFITSSGVTYENLSANSDIGTGATQVAQGDHSHAYSAITGTHGNEDHSSTFITSTGVTYENLNANSDVGTGATQVAQGDHNHSGVYEPADANITKDNEAENITAEWRFSHADGILIDNAIHSGYLSGTHTTAFGATVWGMGKAYTGSDYGDSYAATGVYGISYLRGAHSLATGFGGVGEGLYVLVNGVVQAGIGSSGIKSDGAISGVTIGGITEANLLDKSAAETVSGTWTFSGELTVDSLVTDVDAVGTGIDVAPSGGGIGLTLNDGYGNANVCFNHTDGTPRNTSATQSAGRIVCTVDSDTASMAFQLKGSTTKDTPVSLNQILYLTESYTRTTQPFFIAEGASATTDQAAYGQVWVKNNTPNDLCFTDDAGTDFRVETLFEKDIVIEEPTNTEDISWFYTNRAITIQELVFVLVGSSTPSVTPVLRHSTNRSLAGTSIRSSNTAITNTTTGTIETSFADSTIPANSFVWVETTAQSGTVTSIMIHMEARIDP